MYYWAGLVNEERLQWKLKWKRTRHQDRKHTEYVLQYFSRFGLLAWLVEWHGRELCE